MQYYESEFQNDPASFEYYIKLMAIEPFVHSEISDVLGWAIQPIDKSKKVYFSEWVETKTHDEIILGKLETLRNELTEYSKTKIVKDESSNIE